MSAVFWQRLLAAETTFSRSAAVARDVSGRADADERVLNHPLLNGAERERIGRANLDALKRALEAGVAIMQPGDYPEQLGREDTFPALFTWGETKCLAEPCVAIVGTRGASVYGRAAAAKFAEALARAGATIVSGGALGIDGAAHEAALAAGGKTVAVLGGGIDRVYPARHRGLFGRIREQGVLISQFAVGAVENPYKFLMRNRLIAGLSHVVLVVEAPERSGALSTASAAGDLGKEVFVVPANIENAGFRGSHALIRDGATLCDHPGQILDALRLPAMTAPSAPPKLSSASQKVLQTFGGVARTIDELCDLTELSAAEVLAEVSMLEIEGLILKQGRQYLRRP